MPEFDDDNKTIFSADLDAEEKAAVHSGEERGKLEYMKDHPECGLGQVTLSEAYQRRYAMAFGHE